MPHCCGLRRYLGHTPTDGINGGRAARPISCGCGSVIQSNSEKRITRRPAEFGHAEVDRQSVHGLVARPQGRCFNLACYAERPALRVFPPASGPLPCWTAMQRNCRGPWSRCPAESPGQTKRLETLGRPIFLTDRAFDGLGMQQRQVHSSLAPPSGADGRDWLGGFQAFWQRMVEGESGFTLKVESASRKRCIWSRLSICSTPPGLERAKCKHHISQSPHPPTRLCEHGRQGRLPAS